MTIETLFRVGLAVVLALIASLLFALASRRRQQKGAQTLSSVPDEQTIQEAIKALEKGAALVSASEDGVRQLEQLANRKRELIDEIDKKLETRAQTFKLGESDVYAVRDVLEEVLSSHGKRAFWSSFGISFLWFVAGIVVTVLIELLLFQSQAPSP